MMTNEQLLQQIRELKNESPEQLEPYAPQVAELCLSLADELKAKDAENARLREALEWIVGYDGNQHTTRKAQQALSDGDES